MDDRQRDVGSTPATGTPVEGWMLREDVVREVLARLARGEHGQDDRARAGRRQEDD